MRWDSSKAWDGETCKDEITSALMKWFDSGIKHQALITSYGDLGVLMKTRYRNAGSLRDNIELEGAPQGVCICGTFHGGKRYECCITWNKTAKLISAECHRMAEK